MQATMDFPCVTPRIPANLVKVTGRGQLCNHCTLPFEPMALVWQIRWAAEDEHKLYHQGRCARMAGTIRQVDVQFHQFGGL